MNESFKKALAFTLPHEGYKTDDPRDPGKLTIWGWSMVYHPMEVARMAKLSREDALAYASDLYLKKVWLPAGCDLLPYPKDIVIFEITVNPGPKLGQMLKPAAFTWLDCLFLRIGYYIGRVKEKPYKIVYLKGWFNRTYELYKLVR